MAKKDTKVLDIITKALDDMKAEDVSVIDLEGKTSIAGYMVVASGTSNRHVASIAQKIEEALKANPQMIIDALQAYQEIGEARRRVYGAS